jgi:hypothetical protein
METLTFEELPSAVKLLLDKVTRLEKLLDPDLAVKNGTEKSINVVQAAEWIFGMLDHSIPRLLNQWVVLTNF